MKLKINLTRKPAPGGVFNCKAINIRERLLRFLVGDMHKVTVLIPGDNVGEILICKSGEKLNEKSQTKTCTVSAKSPAIPLRVLVETCI